MSERTHPNVICRGAPRPTWAICRPGSDRVESVGRNRRPGHCRRSRIIPCGPLATVAGADLIILCVKPQAMAGVLEAIRAAATPDNLVLSTAAGVGTAAIERGLGGPVPVVRATRRAGELHDG